MNFKFALKHWLGILALTVVLVSIILFLLYTSENSRWGGGYWESWIVRNLHYSPHMAHLLVYVGRKTMHFLGYGAIGLLCWVYFGAWGLKKPLWAGLALTAAIAVMDEYVQSFTSFRSGKPGDVLIDICGAVVVTGVVYWRYNKF